MRLPIPVISRRSREVCYVLVSFCFAFLCGSFSAITDLHAVITTTGNVSPVPPAMGGPVAGTLRIGQVDVGTMSITGGTSLDTSQSAIIGDTITGLGIVNMSGFGSDWTLATAGADFTVANNGTGSLNMNNMAFLSVDDDFFIAAQVNSLGEMSISGLGTIVDIGDDVNIGQRGQAVVSISDGGRLVNNRNIVGDEPGSDARVTVADQFSLWRAFSTMVIADAGRALLQIFDGARVENTSATIGALSGSAGTVEVAGLGSLWQNSLGVVVGDFGHGTLIVDEGGRVTTGGANLFTIGRQVGGFGQVEVRGLDSLLVATTFEVGDSGDGTLRILDGGRVTSGTALVGDNVTARGQALVDGAGSQWEINGELNLSGPGEAHLTISNGAQVRSSAITRVGALGRLSLDGGRLEIGGTTALLNTGIVEGSGAIEGLILNNNAGGQIRAHDAAPLVLNGTLNNSGLVDVQSGELDVVGPMNNNSDIDARDGAVLRFRGTGLDNNTGSQLAITSGIVDVFGLVDNNSGAQIVVGGEAVAVFHDNVTNNGQLFIQPGGEVFMLENIGFGAGSSLNIQLEAVDPTQGAESSDGFGQVQTGGIANLNGTLAVSLIGGFVPQAGDAFQIVTAAGGVSGTFATEMLPALSGGLSFDVEYNPNSVVLAVIGSGLPGDYNQNGVVDAADYTVWRDTLGQTGDDLAADGDGNEIIDAADYDVWRANFGQTALGATAGLTWTSSVEPPSSTVPEPCTFLCIVAGLAAYHRVRTRRAS